MTTSTQTEQVAASTSEQSIEISPGYFVRYFEHFYSAADADALLSDLLAIDMTAEVIRMFGKDNITKRRTVQYGVPYNYNPTAKQPLPWTPLMSSVKERMESVAGSLHGGLVQVYPDGDASIGWHRDADDPEVIASLSVGAERLFAFGVGLVTKCREVFRMGLGHGSLLLIPASVNDAFLHRLPATKRVKEPRVNVTLRRFPS